MSGIIKIIGAMVALIWLTLPVTADQHMMGKWTLSASESKVAFGSIKKDKVGEVHHFTKISGGVSGDGKVSVAIDVASVETLADIRNERMAKWVFDAAHPMATLDAKIDPHKLAKLKPGETTTLSINGTLTLNGKAVPVEAEMFVARISESKALITTDEMIMLSMSDAGIDNGISKLMEIAKLPSITRVSPVTLRFVFTK